MESEIYRVKAIGKGFLAVMAKPIGEWLDDEIGGIKQSGIDLLVSLLTPPEVYELNLTQEERLCHKHQITFISFPIKDRSVPDNVKSTSELLSQLYQAAFSGQGVVVHCRAGIGRSGLIAAGVLLHDDIPSSEAFALVTKARNVAVPDTEEQISWLEKNASQLVSA